MEPAGPPDPRALVRALSRAQARLEGLRARQREGLRDAQRSLQRSLAALLREEERQRARARAERARLQQALAAAGAANARAGRAAAATSQALQRRLGSLHARLLAAPPAAEAAQEAAALLARSAGLSLTLTRACLLCPPRAAAATILGELCLEAEILSLAPSQAPARDRGEQGEAGGRGARPEGARPRAPRAQADRWGCPPQPDLELSADQPPLRAGQEEEGAQVGPEEPGLGAEQGVGWALPASGQPPALAGGGPGGGPLAAKPPEVVAAMAPLSGRLSPAGLLAAVSPSAGTVFHARAVLVEEEDSDSGRERGAPVHPTDVAVWGDLGTQTRDDSSRWASAESLGALSGAGRGTQTSRGGRGLDLGAQPAARGSASWESLGSSGSRAVRRGAQLGVAAAGPHPQGTQGWLPAQHAPALAWSPRAPPPPCDRLVGQWGQRGSQPGQLYLPHGLHAAPAAGCLYVVDFGNRRLQELGCARRVLPLRGKAYFDVAVGRGGCLALTNSAGRCVELYSAGGLLLQAMREGFRSPRGIAAGPQGHFLVADMHLGALHILGAPVARGGWLRRSHTVPGFHKPYLVAASAGGEVAVSERGLDGGCCVKVLSPTWQVLRVLGGRSSPPVLTNPWGVSLDEAGRVLVVDWGRHSHAILCYPPSGTGWAVATQGLSSPRGLALLGEQHLVVADSMHHCLKTFQYC